MKFRVKLLVAALVIVGSGLALAGDPEPPGPPSSTFSLNLEAIYARLMSGAAGTPTAFTEPSTAPGTGTMVTLEQIMAAAPAEDNTNGAQPGEVLAGKSFWSLRTDGAGGSAWGLSVGTLPTRTVDATTVSQLAGYYEAFNLADVDADLVSGNVRSGTSIFGVAGNPNVVNTSSGDAVAGDILSGKVAWVDGAEVTGNLATRTVDPTTVSQLAGNYAAFNLSSVDPDLVSGNVRSGTSIFGVTGGPNVVNTSSGNALAGEILTGRVAWVDGAQVTGTMPDNGAVTISPGTTAQTIPAGYHNGSGTVAGDADLTGDNIRDGVNIFGVDGYRRVSQVDTNNRGLANVTAASMSDYLRVGDVILWESIFGGYLNDDGDGTVSLDPCYRYNSQAWVVEWNATYSAFMFRNAETGNYLSATTADGIHTGPLSATGQSESFVQAAVGLWAGQISFDYSFRYVQPQGVMTGGCMLVSTYDAYDDTIDLSTGCNSAQTLWRFVILNPDSATKALGRPTSVGPDDQAGTRFELREPARREFVTAPKQETVRQQDQATSGKGN